MPKASNILIHEFERHGPPYWDDEGDRMLGFYFQLTDKDDQPVSDMIGPYPYNGDAERAALRAFHNRDF